MAKWSGCMVLLVHFRVLSGRLRKVNSLSGADLKAANVRWASLYMRRLAQNC